MPSSLNKISKNRVKISGIIPSEEMTKFFESEYQRLAPTVIIPGFRAGKAPRVMTIESIGHSRIANAAVQAALNKGYQDALFEHKHYPVTEPTVSVSKHPVFSEDESQNELKFEIEFDILTDVKIGDYKKIKVDKIDPEKLEVTEEEIGKVVNYLLRQQSQLKEVTRSAKEGDWAQITFKGSVKGVEKEKLTSSSMPVVLGETKLIPGFVEEIVGMKKDERKKIKIKFPKDFQDKEFAGVEAEFDTKLEELKEIELPKLDNEFAKKFGHDSTPKMKAAIKKGLEEEKMTRERQIQRARIGEQIIKMTKIDIPQSLVDREKNRLEELFKKDLSQKGLTLEKYFENAKLNKTRFDEDLKTQAKRNITLGVGLGEVAKAQRISLSTPDATDKVFECLIELSEK